LVENEKTAERDEPDDAVGDHWETPSYRRNCVGLRFSAQVVQSRDALCSFE